MSDTSTLQSHSSSVRASGSTASKTSTPSSDVISRSDLLKKVLLQQNFGLLCLRVVLGATMIAYGVPKFLGGAEYLQQVGSAIQALGINFGFQFFGFLAALTEVVGGVMLILGSYYRASCFGLAFVMVMATLFKAGTLQAGYSATDFISNCLHPLSMAAIFISMMFVGPGRLSLQKE